MTTQYLGCHVIDDLYFDIDRVEVPIIQKTTSTPVFELELLEQEMIGHFCSVL